MPVKHLDFHSFHTGGSQSGNPKYAAGTNVFFTSGCFEFSCFAYTTCIIDHFAILFFWRLSIVKILLCINAHAKNYHFSSAFGREIGLFYNMFWGAQELNVISNVASVLVFSIINFSSFPSDSVIQLYVMLNPLNNFP
jgi:hypothetical protein